MTVNVLLITHTDVGQALMQVVETTFGQLPTHWRLLPVGYQQAPERLLDDMTKALHALPNSDGTLVITDVFGATPCNVASTLKQQHNVRLISGVNLPMLFKIMNYADLPLDELAEKALIGGRDGIRLC